MDLLNCKQLAEQYNISYPHVLAAARSGTLPSLLCGGSYLVQTDNAKVWAQQYFTEIEARSSEHWRDTVARLTARVAQLEAQVIELGGQPCVR